MVPIGDRFTMSPTIAALAVKRFLQARCRDPVSLWLVPDHRGDADKFLAEMKGHATKVIVPEKGKPFTV